MITTCLQPLDLAVGQGLSVDIVTHIGGTAQRYRGKFLARGRGRGDGVWVHALGEDGRGVERLAAARGPALVTFNVNGVRYRFATRVVRRDRQWFNNVMMVDAVLLAEPPVVDRVEHREHERVL